LPIHTYLQQELPALFRPAAKTLWKTPIRGPLRGNRQRRAERQRFFRPGAVMASSPAGAFILRAPAAGPRRPLPLFFRLFRPQFFQGFLFFTAAFTGAAVPVAPLFTVPAAVFGDPDHGESKGGHHHQKDQNTFQGHLILSPSPGACPLYPNLADSRKAPAPPVVFIVSQGAKGAQAPGGKHIYSVYAHFYSIFLYFYSFAGRPLRPAATRLPGRLLEMPSRKNRKEQGIFLVF